MKTKCDNFVNRASFFFKVCGCDGPQDAIGVKTGILQVGEEHHLDGGFLQRQLFRQRLYIRGGTVFKIDSGTARGKGKGGFVDQDTMTKFFWLELTMMQKAKIRNIIPA